MFDFVLQYYRERQPTQAGVISPHMSTPLQTTTAEQAAGGRRARAVNWYRTALPAETLKRLHERSDFWGWLQAGGYFAVLVASGSLAWYSVRHWSITNTVLCVFLHGTCFAFQINAVHERH